ncbi:MAG: hypothetical protein ACK55I_37470 [bacterium]
MSKRTKVQPPEGELRESGCPALLSRPSKGRNWVRQACQRSFVQSGRPGGGPSRGQAGRVSGNVADFNTFAAAPLFITSPSSSDLAPRR